MQQIKIKIQAALITYSWSLYLWFGLFEGYKMGKTLDTKNTIICIKQSYKSGFGIRGSEFMRNGTRIVRETCMQSVKKYATRLKTIFHT